MSGTVIDENDGTSGAPVDVTTSVFEPTVTYTVTKDSGTPTGEAPTVYFSADAVVGTVNISSQNGAVVYVTEALDVGGTYNITADGGTVILETATTGVFGTNNLTITGNGTLETSGTLVGAMNGGVIDFGTGSNTLILSSSGSGINLSNPAPINNFQSNDTVIDKDIDYANVTSYTVTDVNGQQVATFYNSSGTSLGSLTFTGGTFQQTGNFSQNTGPLSIVNGPSGSLEVNGCFLRGTHILAQDGEVLVEDLEPGDLVATLSGDEIVMRPVQWIGQRSVSVSGEGLEAYPVRIRAGAFGENIPHRDLLVTSEHCIFTAGVFIPARMLVNGGSISFDTSIKAYSYYHVELAEHAVLMSEGLTSESYLDTGNRGRFANAAMVDLHPAAASELAVKTWAEHAAAPLAVDRATVEPIWRGLTARAAACGFVLPPRDAELTDDPALHLVTQAGLEIRPSRVEGNVYAFLVPGGAGPLRLVSRAARPCDVVGPYLDDRRRLGVLVSAIKLGGQTGAGAVQPHLSAKTLAGWHPVEDGADARWTNGNAILPVDLSAFGAMPVRLQVELAHAGPYKLARPVSGREKRAA